MLFDVSHAYKSVLGPPVQPIAAFAPQSRTELQEAIGSCLEQSPLPTSNCTTPPPNATLTTQLRVASWNVLANYWCDYKYYELSLDETEKCWPYRKELTKQYILKLNADILTLQEINPSTFEEDFSFMSELGYDGIMEKSNNKYMRCAIFWRRGKLTLVQSEHRVYKCQIVQLKVENTSSDCESASNELAPQEHVFVLTCHLSVGNPYKRVRELQNVLWRTQNLRVNGGILREHVAIVLTGDFNTWPDIADSPVRSFLLDGTIGPDFNEKYPVHTGGVGRVAGMT